MCLLSMKEKVNVGTWNVRTMFEAIKTAQIANGMRRYHIEVIGICECRWNGSGLSKMSTGESIIYSDIVTQTTTTSTLSFGVAIMISPRASKGLFHAMGTNLLQDHDRKIQLKRKEGHNHTMLRCAPTNNAEQEEKEEFYKQFQSTLDKTPVGDIKILMGDMNAKLRGAENTGRELTMGREALGEVMNENGELFAEFCAFNDLVIGGQAVCSSTRISTEPATWISPDGHIKNQIDFISISRKRRWRRSLLNTRSRRGADVGSDHHPVQATYLPNQVKSLQGSW
ncbi:unnamed protein product [Heterobilharzia americana]|nr:unnamed protein product [Heterobilharzia americana]